MSKSVGLVFSPTILKNDPLGAGEIIRLVMNWPNNLAMSGKKFARPT